MADIAQVQEILNRADGLFEGPMKIALHEEAVRLADLAGSIDWQFHTRHELVRVAFLGGEPDKMLVALSWSLAKCDELGRCFNEHFLLWGCKYALSYITAFPQISRTQIESLQHDAENRFRKFGASMRSPYLRGMMNQLFMGYPDKAVAYRQRWHDAPRDEFSEPSDWECHDDAYFLSETGEMDRALELAMPMIEGRQRSLDVYHWMVNLFLLELLKRGQREIAMEAHRQAYRLCADNPKFLGHLGAHIAFLALTGNFTSVVRLLENHLPWALESRVPSATFSFMLGAWTAVRQLQAKDCKVTPIRLPMAFPLWRADGVYPWPMLADWFEQQTHELEVQFNTRNGNERFSKSVAEYAALSAWTTDWPIRR